jgi:hypothetical protein
MSGEAFAGPLLTNVITANDKTASANTNFRNIFFSPSGLELHEAFIDFVLAFVSGFPLRNVTLLRTIIFYTLERMYLLVGLALLLWTSAGQAVEEEEPKVRPRSKTKGARLSLARIGSYYWQKVTKRLKLTTRLVREHLPPPRLRVFKWLTATQN